MARQGVLARHAVTSTGVAKARHRGAGGCGESGAVTAELAIGFTSITIALAAVLSTVSVGAAQLAVTGAAHAAARAAARGEGPAQAVLLGARLAGADARIGISRGSQLTRVTVERGVALPLPGRPVLTTRAHATALTEEHP